MGLTYKGDCDFAETEDSGRFSIDPWGMDVLTRIRKGRVDRLSTELALYDRRRDIKDSEYADFYLSRVNPDPGRAFATVTLEYVGIRGGKIPDPVFKSGFRASTVSLPYAGIGGELDGTSTTLKYYAPYTTAMYVLKDKPKGAKYRDKIELIPESLQIISVTGDDTREISYKRASADNGDTLKTPNAYNALIEVYTSQFDWKKAGQWYEVTETNEAVIIPAGLRIRRIARL